MDIKNIKSRLPIKKVLTYYNIPVNRNHHIHCPFHEDKTPSCRVYETTNSFYCFGCGKTGDVIDFIMYKEGITKHEAILKAKELAGMVKETPEISPKAIQSEKETDYNELFSVFVKSIERSESAKNYCHKRRLDYKTLQIGYNSGKLFNKLKNCIIFPLKDKEGKITSLYGRSINENNTKKDGKHYYSENRSGLYPCYPGPETEILILTEAIIDAATLLQIPEITSHFTILSCYGNVTFTKEIQESVKELPDLKEVIIFFDGDQGGIDGIKHVSEILHQIKQSGLLSQVEVTVVETPEKEDINSLYVKYGKEYILNLIKNRKPCETFTLQISQSKQANETETSFSTEPNLIEKKEIQSQEFKLPLPLNTENPNKIIYETQTARYIVKGGLPRQLDKMVISLDIQHLETGIKYRTRLDLYEEKQIRKEAREAAEKLDLRADLIEADMSSLCDLLEELREKEFENIKKSHAGDSEILVPLAEQSRCKDFLSKPNLINRINELISKSGITGEENNRIFLFIIATSYKMPDTLHALIQGSSGSGKTHLLGKIADLIPQEKVERFTRITDNSLYNYGEYELIHHLLCLEDVDGLKEEALFAWRELISNNMLRSSTSQKDDNGNSRGIKRIVRGPMASICATTHGHIYEDNMSRLFIIAVDESPEQTARIIDYQSKLAAGIIKKEDEIHAKEFIQNCVRMLKPYKVVNPYADKIKLPQQAHKIRRLHELFLCFVRQITLINQYQRRKDTEGRLITEKEDLETAIEIMFNSILLKVDELDGSLRQFYEDLKQYIKTKPNPENYEFIQREIRFALFKSKSQLQRYINTLLELEYIQQTAIHGKGNRYKILWWDNFEASRENLKKYLKEQVENI